MKKFVGYVLFLILVLTMCSCCELSLPQGPPPGPSYDLSGPYVNVETIANDVISGKYTSNYGNKIFYFDSMGKGIAVLDAKTGEERFVYPVDTISKITASDKYIVFEVDDTIYQINHSGELINSVDRFSAVNIVAALDDVLFVQGEWQGNEDILLYALPLDDITVEPVGVVIKYESVEKELNNISKFEIGRASCRERV